MPRNIFLNTLVNIAVPVMILTQASENLNPILVLCLALSFPLFYGVIEMKIEKRLNFLSLLGFISIILTGIISIMGLSNQYLVWKEAGIPLAIAMIILISEKTDFPVTKKLLGEIFRLKIIREEYKKRGKEKILDRGIKVSTYVLVSAFIISSIANYIIAKIIVISPPGTIEYNEEIAKMISFSFPVITIPMTAVVIVIIFAMIWNIHKNTNLELEQITW